MDIRKDLCVCLFVLMCLAPCAAGAGAVDESCHAKGVRLYGRVKVVTHHGDIRVKIVSSFPDLKVQPVNAFPNKCGKWQFVESCPDFTIQFVDSFPDVKIQYVNAFPGRK